MLPDDVSTDVPIPQKRKGRPGELENLTAVAVQFGGTAGNRMNCLVSPANVQSVRCTALEQKLV